MIEEVKLGQGKGKFGTYRIRAHEIAGEVANA